MMASTQGDLFYHQYQKIAVEAISYMFCTTKREVSKTIVNRDTEKAINDAP